VSAVAVLGGRHRQAPIGRQQRRDRCVGHRIDD
jgi:hypothetical protein